jgi:hypothetical protein
VRPAALKGSAGGRACTAPQVHEVRMVPSLGAGAGAWCPAVSRRIRARRMVVRAEGVEPSRAVKLNGFSYRLRLSPPGRSLSERARPVCGLDYPFTVPRKDPGLRCCPSSLYTFPAGGSLRAWLGIAISGSPEFGQFCIAGFPDEHSSFLKSVASAISPRPRGRLSIAVYHRAA